MKRKEDFMLLVASLSIALAMWLQVSPLFDNNKEREIDVALETKGLPDGLWIVSPQPTVKIVASGTTSDLDRFNERSVTASVDLSRAVAKPYDAKVMINAPAGIPITFKPKNNTIRLSIEKLQEKDQTVELLTTGLPSTGFIYDGATLTPQIVKITGPSSTMAQVFRARVILNLSDLKMGTPYLGKIVVLDAKNIPLPYVKADPEMISINPAIVIAPASRQFLVTPTWVNHPPFGYTIASFEVRPQQVRMKGESAKLSGITTIDTEEIDLAGLKADTSLTVKLKVPIGMTTNVDTVRVTVKIASQSTGKGARP